MRLSLGLVSLYLAMALGQMAECPSELVETDDCADTINPAACYNQFRFRNLQTLQCIDGETDADKRRKACNCCSCVGQVMCDWVQQFNICS